MRLNTPSTAAALASMVFLGSVQLAAVAQRSESNGTGVSNERLQRIGATIQRYIAAGDIAGAVTLVAHRGHVVHFETHGVMDLESKRPMSKDTVFALASMTKPIAAAAILMLNEEGRLRLTDPVSRFIPEYTNLKVAVLRQPHHGAVTADTAFDVAAADRQITIRDLLTHTSGIVTDVGTISNREAEKLVRQPADTLANHIPRLAAVPLEFQPGTRWQYSPGVGFDVLGRVVEIASGRTFDRFLRERIFEPLGMKDTTFNVGAAQQARLATRYERTPKGLQKLPPRAATVYYSGGGGLMSTAEDYLRFAQMLLNGGQLNGSRLLSPRAVELLRSVHIADTLPGRLPGEGYGLGVRVVSEPAKRGVWLTTGSFGWSGAAGTHFWVDPKEELVAILMVHTRDVGLRADFENVVSQAVGAD